MEKSQLFKEILAAITWAHKVADLEPDYPALSRALASSAENVPGLDDRDTDVRAPFDEAILREFASGFSPKMRDARVGSSEEDWLRWHEFDGDIDEVTEDEIRDGACVALRHRYLESLFSDWLGHWHYDVETGKELDAVADLVYVADVHGRLQNLHGNYEVCVNFICDEGVSSQRAGFLLDRVGAYASLASTTFGDSDVYILATPFAFDSETKANARRYRQTYKFKVVLLDGEDLQELTRAHLLDDVLNGLRRRLHPD